MLPDGSILADASAERRARVTRRRFDAVELELLWRRLISLVDEAAAALVRTSFSTLVRESYDFSCVVTDAEGQSLVQATESIPSFIGTLPATVKHFLRFFPPETLEPGDVLITNDLWLGTGHLPDITVAKPIFRGGRLVAFSASTAHAPDIGGKIRSPEPREVFEEGLQIPPLKLMRRGETDETLVAMIRQNVRTPDQTLGDLWAQVVALDVMEDRLLSLMERPRAARPERPRARRSRAAARPPCAPRSPPCRTAPTAASCRPTGCSTRPSRIRMALTVRGDEIEIDFAGHRRAGGPGDQLRPLLHLRHVHVRGEGLHRARPCRTTRAPGGRSASSAPPGCIVNPAVPGLRRVAHADRPLPADAGLRLPRPSGAGAGDGGLRLAHVGHEPVGRARAGGPKPYANMFFFNGGMGGEHARGRR